MSIRTTPYYHDTVRARVRTGSRQDGLKRHQAECEFLRENNYHPCGWRLRRANQPVLIIVHVAFLAPCGSVAVLVNSVHVEPCNPCTRGQHSEQLNATQNVVLWWDDGWHYHISSVADELIWFSE